MLPFLLSSATSFFFLNVFSLYVVLSTTGINSRVHFVPLQLSCLFIFLCFRRFSCCLFCLPYFCILSFIFLSLVFFSFKFGIIHFFLLSFESSHIFCSVSWRRPIVCLFHLLPFRLSFFCFCHFGFCAWSSRLHCVFVFSPFPFFCVFFFCLFMSYFSLLTLCFVCCCFAFCVCRRLFQEGVWENPKGVLVVRILQAWAILEATEGNFEDARKYFG